MNTKTLIKPIVAPKIIPKITVPAEAVSSTKPMTSLPVPTTRKTIPCVVGVFIEVASDPREGLGAAFLRVSRDAGTREIGVSLFHERLIVSRSVNKSDELVLRYLASFLLVECLGASRVSGHVETKEVMTGLKAVLGGPWSFGVNLSFLATRLARHDAAGVGQLLETPQRVVPWFSIPCQGPPQSSFWQWNSALTKPDKTK